MSKISLATLKNLLTPQEMKNVTGGSGEGSWCSDLKTCKVKNDCDVLTQNCGLMCEGVKKCY